VFGLTTETAPAPAKPNAVGSEYSARKTQTPAEGKDHTASWVLIQGGDLQGIQLVLICTSAHRLPNSSRMDFEPGTVAGGMGRVTLVWTWAWALTLWKGMIG
jgi:hypothetical protein